MGQKDRDLLRSRYPMWMEQHHFMWLWLGSAHVIALYYTYLNAIGAAPITLALYVFETFYGYIGGLGITIGCHRYWTHKTFKATLPLQYILMIMQTIAGQFSIYKWTLDHRLHHKYTDTNSDPHNATRGFWFSHMGWMFVKKHPELEEKLQNFAMPDLESDPVVRFQSKYYFLILFISSFIIPVSITYYFFGIPFLFAVMSNFRRYIFSLHFTWTVNSFAHLYGDKPYDKNISSTDNKFVSIVAVGEGWHNYHHTFPWDYKTSEFGWKLNLSTILIDLFAYLGMAYDLKTVPAKMLNDRRIRTGDGGDTSNEIKTSKPKNKDLHSEYFWGWDDEAIPEEFRKATKILSRQ